MAGAAFGELGVSFFVAGAAFPAILGDSRVRDDDFMVGLSSDYPRIMVGLSSDHGGIVFILAEAIQGFLAQILNSKFRGRHSLW